MLDDGRVFPAGTQLGFFLISDGWHPRGRIRPQNTAGTWPHVLFTHDFLNPAAEDNADVETDSSTNNSRQVALMYSSAARNEIIMGFEDISRRLPPECRVHPEDPDTCLIHEPEDTRCVIYFDHENEGALAGIRISMTRCLPSAVIRNRRFLQSGSWSRIRKATISMVTVCWTPMSTAARGR